MNDKISLDNFVLHTMIGKGSYAKVVLVKKKVNDSYRDVIGY